MGSSDMLGGTVKADGLLMQLVKRGHDAVGTVESAAERLHSEIDTLIGSSPEVAPTTGRGGADPGPTQHSGVYGELEVMVQRIEAVAYKAEQAVARACRLNN